MTFKLNFSYLSMTNKIFHIIQHKKNSSKFKKKLLFRKIINEIKKINEEKKPFS